LLPLIPGGTLLQQTAQRLARLPNATDPIVIANDDHRFLIRQQLSEIGITPAPLILEPMGRNTAPAVALACHAALQGGEDPILGIFPSDHHIADDAAFQAAVATAVQGAKAGYIVTFSITPTQPETGYGYIRHGGPVSGLDGIETVAGFVEKPDRDTAQRYLDSGGYGWNSGMFMFRASIMRQALERFAPDVLRCAAAALANASLDLGFTRLDADAFAASPSIAIDVAVMERTDQATTVAADMGWSDLGSWEALHGFAQKDSNGNATQGKVQLRDTKNSYFRSDDGRLLAGIGVEDMVVIATADAVLVAPLSRAAEVKELVNDLSANKAPEADLHRKVSRPWGTYQDIDRDAGFRAKRIVVHPGGRLSLQRHHKRSEHWVVVKGTAHVTIDGVETVLTRNQSTYVSIGATHRLENKSDEPLHLIEVQVGDYVEEDDIERLDDVYGRTQ
jgi:mannose-1-phosphate guanylyltransferase/mannose-6-phosphate isomerase